MSSGEIATEGWMPTEVLFILALHSIAAVVSAVMAFRDGLSLLQSLRSGGLGFITGLFGLINRARMDPRNLHYMHVVQDACINLGLEAFALYGIPYFLK
jgi:hypothetical protein